jgi:hypothetical protein
MNVTGALFVAGSAFEASVLLASTDVAAIFAFGSPIPAAP